MSGSRQSETFNTTPKLKTEWDIGTYLRYEHERPDVVALTCDWRGEVPTLTIDAALAVLRGDYPRNVYLAELPRPGAWTRKLKLIVPGQESRIVTVAGGGTPRLWLGNEVAYQLPNLKARYMGAIYRYAMSNGKLAVEKLTFDEPQGGLALSLSHHIHDRMVQARALIDDRVIVPDLAARGQFSMPGWNGAFLIYSEAVNYRPSTFLRLGRGYSSLGHPVRLKAFCLGVHNLLHTLRKLNDGGMFHGDLVHRVHGGSANLGFTPQGQVVLKGWGHRIDVKALEWPPEALHRQRMREVTGALAGLLEDLLNSDLPQEERKQRVVELVSIGLKAYTGRSVLDPVELMIGLTTETNRLHRSMPMMPGGYDFQDDYDGMFLYSESSQLPDEMRNWLVQCVFQYV
ncbi:MAG TPA: hypothetical protein PKD09_05620 [Aggregatilinea sp.]|jgi:hypothetical protein|uniref:hypothetical protein n=1 Tax=Aggregatilinea sp. TaxID=2806333 RepID=UPI002B96154D|nr:hypothetical protein [Aggregatilinea sp.]HML21106.1 hypothetical protein [Aggregatilinea sp.]